MRIISKHKDYYDFVVGKYGIDPLITLVRKAPNRAVEMIPSTLYTEEFHICDRSYTFHYYYGKMYHTKTEIEKLNKLLIPSEYDAIYWNHSWHHSASQSHFDKTNRVVDTNTKCGIPVVRVIGYTYDYDLEVRVPDYEEVNLSLYGIGKYIEPEEMYLNIYTFLSKLRDKDIVNKQTDMEKLLSHGFDKKKSFRHRK